MSQAGGEAAPVVIVTGSSGFIGAALIRRLAERYRVVGFDRDVPPHPPAEAECVCIDLADDSSVEAAFRRVRTAYGAHVASVVHLAAYFDLTGEPSPLYEAVTVKGTERLLRALQAFDVKQFVFASTMLVHAATPPGRPINEEAPLEATLPYRESKIRTERLIHAQRGPIHAVMLRPAGSTTPAATPPSWPSRSRASTSATRQPMSTPATSTPDSPPCTSKTWSRRWSGRSTAARTCRPSCRCCSASRTS